MSNNHIRFSPPVASLTVAGGKAPERAAGKSVLTVARDQTLSEGIAANSNTGYYFQQLISGSSCHGTPYYASGWLTNTCILTEGGAFYYTCDAGTTLYFILRKYFLFITEILSISLLVRKRYRNKLQYHKLQQQCLFEVCQHLPTWLYKKH
jgi:hypothetical protein